MVTGVLMHSSLRSHQASSARVWAMGLNHLAVKPPATELHYLISFYCKHSSNAKIIVCANNLADLKTVRR